MPLSRLSKEQYTDLTIIVGEFVKPVLVIVEIKRRDLDLFSKIRASEYNYIIISLEQAISNDFKDVLKDLNTSSRLRLISFNKIYLLSK